MVAYKTGLPISPKMFNFSKFGKSLGVDAFLSNPNILTCECANSLFINKYHKHNYWSYTYHKQQKPNKIFFVKD